MQFSYAHYGDILYGLETFRFRYQGTQTADIELLSMLDDGQYAFQIQIDEERVKEEYRNSKLTSNDYDLYKKLDLTFTNGGLFPTKQKALQEAINLISYIIDNHSDVPVIGD